MTDAMGVPDSVPWRAGSLDAHELIRRLPKIEMHLHLEGAIRADTAVALARKNDTPLPPFARPQDLFTFTDLPSFLVVYTAIAQAVRTADDFRRITYEMLESCAKNGARRVEFFISPHAHKGVDFGVQFDGLRAGMREASEDFGLSSGFSPGVNRELGPASGEEYLDRILEHRSDELIGLGLDYNEPPYPPEPFTQLFSRARASGLRLSAHAGETGPAAFVKGSIEALKVDRIDHGYNIMHDPALVESCRASGLMFTCCPTNTRFTFSGIDMHDPRHPIRAMREAGLVVSINSDDPTMMQIDLAHEYQVAMNELGFTPADIKSSIIASVKHCWVDDGTRRQWLRDWPAEIDAVFASLARS
jgi:adenosine deaminase